MEISAQQVGTKLTVELSDVSNTSKVVEIVEGCASGACVCSTDEFQKVENIAVIPGENSVLLNVEVLPGEIIDKSCITECFSPVAD